ncbi:MAG: hypothetical protein EA350_03620 [Gemmatimonadales bacterium]|nr:MAG: hypothetical protein EA350_03620 [Gemmatimonadales bacterium]
MVNSELLDILVCPETRTPVRLADADLLAKVNRAISEGTLLNREGTPVRGALDAALVREDGLLLYPIRDDIPVMLIDEAIPLDAFS